MVVYNLEHLTQDASEKVLGPIQDTEALFLFSVVRGMRMKRVLEIGGLSGYSAKNFLQAFARPTESTLYTVDVDPVPQLAPNHCVLLKDARTVTREDLHGLPLDLVFFDCHDYDAQMEVYQRFVDQGIITPRTVLALHDTNVHPYKAVDWAYPVPSGWVHQAVERRMVNRLVELGYHAFSLHTPNESHGSEMPFRHGVTLMQRFVTLEV